ncbi:MAG: DUF3240 family protein [Gammaproteobacteria bacterium]|jgi:hypothetical protein
MSNSTPEQVLVVITSPPSLESDLVDWLLARDGGTGFSSAPVRGHSTRHGHLSVAEQVSGRQRRIQFQVQIGAPEVEECLASLVSEFEGADMHYWVLPMLAGGHLG